jgi:hypothetical protein
VKTLALLALTAAMAVPAGEATAANPQPHGPTGSWRMVWHDEFTHDAADPDPTKWSMPSWRMNNVIPSTGNMWVYNGNLVLNLASAGSGAAVLSTRKLNIGEVAEARITFPGSDTGDHIFNFPAFWTAGVNYPEDGEHDIAEGLGDLWITYWTGQTTIGFKTRPAGDWNNAFHRFTLWRRAADARVYWDGELVGSYRTADGGGPEHLIVNVGSSPKRTLVTGHPSRVRVDYVRVWSK